MDLMKLLLILILSTVIAAAANGDPLPQVTGVAAGPVIQGNSNNDINQTVNWNQVNNTVQITGYILRYWGENGRNESVTISKRKTSEQIALKLPSDKNSYSYYVTVSAKSSGKEGPPSETLTIKYRKPGAVRMLKLAATCNSVTATWKPPSSSGKPSFGHYTIMVDSNAALKTLGKEQTSFTIPVLKANTKYKVTVRAHSAIFQTSNSKPVATLQGGMVTAAMLEPISATELRVSVPSDGNEYVCTLTAAANFKMNFNISAVAMTSKQLKSLTPNTYYALHCVGYYANGTESCKEAIESATTMKLPEQVTANTVTIADLRRSTNSTHVMQPVTWDKPNSDQEISNYVVEYRRTKEGSWYNHTVNNASIVLALPLPQSNTTYSLRVAAVSVAGKGNFSEVSNFSYTTPGNNGITFNISSTCSSLTLHWTAPSDIGNLDITSYQVKIADEEIPVPLDPNVRMHTFTGLHPNRMYSYQVKAMNLIGYGPYTATQSTTTSPRGQGQVTAESMSSYNLTLRHDRAHTTYRCSLSVEGKKAIHVNVTSEQTVTVTGTLPDKVYNIGCLGYDRQGQEVCLEVNTSIPTRAPKVEGITFGNTTVKDGKIHQGITWNAIHLKTSMFQKYIIRYSVSASPSKTDLKDDSLKANAVLELNLSMLNITYYIRVAVRPIEDGLRGDFSDPVHIAYTTPGPPKGLTVVNTTCHSITFQWSPPDDTGRLEVTDYDIIHNGTSMASVTGTVYTLDGLTPGTEQTISVRSRNAIGPSVLEGTLTATLNKRTRDEGSIAAESISSHNLTLSHTRDQTTYRCLLSAEKLETRHVNVTSEEAVTVTGTLPDTVYNIRCIGYDQQGQPLCLEANESITTRPPKVQGVAFGSNTVMNGKIHQEITWTEIELNHSTFEEYKIRYGVGAFPSTTDPNRDSSETSNTSLMFNFNASNITYYVQVAVKPMNMPRGDFSDPVNITYTIPGPPKDLKMVRRTCHSITINWSSPDNTGKLDITGYDIMHNGTLVTNTGTEYTLKGLMPDTSHTITARSRNAIGSSMFNKTLTVTSKIRGEGMVTAESVSSYNLTLSHDRDAAIYRCLLAAEGPVTKQVHVNVTRGQTVIVTGTLPDKVYNIGCLGYDKQGQDLCLEVNTSVTTRPPKVENVTFGKNTVKGGKIHQEITWSAIKLNQSIFQKYIIRYSVSAFLSHETEPNKESSKSNVTLMFSFNTSNITYHVQVAVSPQNIMLRGDYSDPVQIAYTTPGPPKDLTVVNTTCHSITFKWSPPDDTGRLDVTGYEIMHNGTSLPSVTGTVYTLKGLTPDTEQNITVRSRNAIGPSRLGGMLTVTSNKRDESMVVTAVTISSRSVRIGAFLPNAQTHRLEYSCNLTAEDRNIILMTAFDATTNNSMSYSNVTNLSPYTTYTATCLVFKDGVDQCYIGNDTTQTYTDKPSGPPQGIYVVTTSSHSFTIRWNPPFMGQQNGEVMSYEVQYNEKGSNSTVVNVTEELMYTAEDLTTDRVYQFRVAATTVNGTGVFSNTTEVTTIPTVTNLTAVNTTTNSTIITWDQPPQNYSVWLHGEATDNIPQNRFIGLINVTGQTTLIIRGLNSFRNYSISVYLGSELGSGSNATVTVRTLGRAPDRNPINLTATPTSRSVTLQWSPPPVLSRNGILTHYVVRLANETTMWNITQPHKVAGDLRRRREAVSEGVGEETQSLRVQHLKPFTNYTWEVEAVSDFGSSPPSDMKRFETDQDVPTHITNITVNHAQKTISWTAPIEPNGIIVRYRVQYWELGRRAAAEGVNTTTAEGLMFSYSNFTEGVPYKVQIQAATVAGLGMSIVVEEVLFSQEKAPAVSVSNITVTRVNDTAVMITWRALTLNDARGFPSYTLNVTDNGEVVSSQSTNSTSVMISGLMPHTEYNITVQALTAGKSKEGPWSAPVTIETIIPVPTVPSTLSTWILLVIAVAIVLAAVTIFVVVVAVICRCRRYKSIDTSRLPGFYEDIPMKDRKIMNEGIPNPLDQVPPIVDPADNIQRKEAVLRHNFCEHVQKMHQDKNAPFVAEYQSITSTPDGVNTAVCQSNVIKNRYINVFPYDHSRVVLNERNDNGSDYINAAYIDAYNRTNGYIATQGPTPETMADFWQMVWEQHAPVIVMLTKLVEKGRTKCEQYWSVELNVPYLPGRDLSVTTVRFDTHPEFELRTVKVEKMTSKEEPLVVKHFLYTAWPDHGVPQYSSSIHRFISERVRPVYKDSPAPLIVHCSAGAGRTGTYMAIDTMMYQLEEREDINIFEYVELMRTRRTQMVQNASQYIYVHDAINDYINCKNTTIVAHELRPRIEELKQIDPATKSSGFVSQFLLLEELSTKLSAADYTFAREDRIMSRNRNRDLCPYSDKHITKEDGSYVNASEISGYCGLRNFIAAQAPMGTTEEDVWNMIWKETCTTVVVLCNYLEDSEEMCSTFWPLKTGEPKEFGLIKVCLEEKEEHDHYKRFPMTVSYSDNPKPLKVVLFHYLQWHRYSHPKISTFLQLMGEVEKSQHNAKGPTLVMCNDGMSRTGVFITAMAEVERVKVQGEVDIFQTVKAARSERPHMVSTPVDYEVCHEILVSYLESFDTYANFK